MGSNLQVTLYTKDGCSLCDKVKAQLALLQTTQPHQLKEVDITQDEALFAQYKHAIPVVLIGESTLKAPILAVDLEAALQENRT